MGARFFALDARVWLIEQNFFTGLWYPNLNGQTHAVFRTDQKHHLVSLASMFGEMSS